MGVLVSRAWGLVKLILELKAKFDAIERRLKRSPGLPVQYATTSFWMVPPSPIANHQSPQPGYADVVIIGSGITGTAIARTILDYAGKETLSVVMVEARAACSGATGRNGGHINPPLYTDYSQLKSEFGVEMAERIIRWRLSHIRELQRVASEEGISEQCQIREVDCVDVYYTSEDFEEAKHNLAVWKEEMPNEAEDVHSFNAEEARSRFRLAAQAVGAVVAPGGAIHPYSFVTMTLSNLLKRHSERFSLLTHTPCLDIKEPHLPGQPYYTIQTSRGILTTPHIIHATNGWSSHLLPGFRSKIVPFRGHMSAQRPGKSLSDLPVRGGRTHIFYSGNGGYDYLTQLPGGERELMFGGGFLRNGQLSLSEVGEVDDGGIDLGVASHISGALPLYFGLDNWGTEAEPARDVHQWQSGRIKALWTGVIAFSVDGRPWVGRIPATISKRKDPSSSLTPQFAEGGQEKAAFTAPPGEWIAAAFTGEGMVNAWQSGRALAYIVLGVEKEERLEEWFPAVMRVSEKRWRKASIEKMLDRF